MKVYVDSEYPDSNFHCYTTNPDGLFRAFDVPYFDGKCQTFIEGYRFVPEGHCWKRDDGKVFYGEMVAPRKPYEELDSAQREYEREKLADAENALAIIFGGDVT